MSTFEDSPTGVSTWDECERKWGFRYVARVSSPPNKSAALGTDTHLQLELYLQDGTPLDFTRPSGAILRSGLHLFPAPKTPGMLTEGEFRFTSPRTGFRYMGKRDVALPIGIPQPQLGFTGDVPAVYDLKTSKAVARYAKNQDDLRRDPQAGMYAFDAMQTHGTNHANLAWIYVQTEGSLYAQPVTLRMSRGEAESIMGVVEVSARRRREVLAVAPQVTRIDGRPNAAEQAAAIAWVRENLPPTIASCKNFGGCPNQPLCALSSTQRMAARMGLISSNLKKPATAPAAAVPPTSSPEPSAPATMGCSDRDVPAPTEIPAAFLGDEPVNVNAPEGKMPPQATAPTPETPAAASSAEEKPKRTRRTKEQIEADKAAAKAAPAPIADSLVKKAGGFTLYVDCLPTKGARAAVHAAEYMPAAHAAVEALMGVPDYRLIDYGKGTPHFTAAFLEAFDGCDVILDTRTHEGGALLEALTVLATTVVRGLR